MRWGLLALLAVLVGTANADAPVLSENGYCNGMKIDPAEYDKYSSAQKQEYDTELKFYKDCEVILGDFYILSNAETNFLKLQEITGTLYIGKATKNIEMPDLVVIHGESLYDNQYSFVFDGYQGKYFIGEALTLIRNGKLLVRDTPYICNLKNAIDYKTLFRLAPNEVAKDRYVVVNSYTGCPNGRQKCPSCANFCWASDNNGDLQTVGETTTRKAGCQNRPYDTGSCECSNDPRTQRPACYNEGAQDLCCDESCDGPCVKMSSGIVRCAACPKDKALDASSGKCVSCTTIKFGNVCKSTDSCPGHLIKFNGRCHSECPFGMTAIKDKNSEIYNCVGCPLSLNGDKLFATCGRVCNVKVSAQTGQLTSSNVYKLLPEFGRYKYSDPDYIVEEPLLCDVLLGDVNADALNVVDADLWFLTRLRYIFGKISRSQKVPKPILFYGNAYYIGNTGANFENSFLDLAETGKPVIHGVPPDSCICTGGCHIPNHCISCANKREVIDDSTGFLATYCSNVPPKANEYLDKSPAYRQAGDQDRNIILPCHSSCKVQTGGKATCRGQTSFDCEECKMTLIGYNIKTCVESCPMGYYQKDRECHRCHATCRQGCRGPDATYGPSGCNFCYSFVSPPAGASPKEPLCFKPAPEVGGRIAQAFEKDRAK